jgi:hypothetical protein
MDSIREQMEVSNQISEAISSPHNLGINIDEDELKDELAELEDQQLQERLAGAERVPLHSPVSNRVAAPRGKSLCNRVTVFNEGADVTITLPTSVRACFGRTRRGGHVAPAPGRDGVLSDPLQLNHPSRSFMTHCYTISPRSCVVSLTTCNSTFLIPVVPTRSRSTMYRCVPIPRIIL